MGEFLIYRFIIGGLSLLACEYSIAAAMLLTDDPCMESDEGVQ